MLAWLSDVWHRFAPPPAASQTSELGARGESAAADYLVKRSNYAIVARNWRNPRDERDEIDLVARDGDVLVFIEVKARSAEAKVPGFNAVDERKKRVLRRAVHAYLSGLAQPPRNFRFDVVEVALSNRLPTQCLHFENVPLFPHGYHAARQTGSVPAAPEVRAPKPARSAPAS